jgi:hypothetical protein
VREGVSKLYNWLAAERIAATPELTTHGDARRG